MHVIEINKGVIKQFLTNCMRVIMENNNCTNMQYLTRSFRIVFCQLQNALAQDSLCHTSYVRFIKKVFSCADLISLC